MLFPIYLDRSDKNGSETEGQLQAYLSLHIQLLSLFTKS